MRDHSDRTQFTQGARRTQDLALTPAQRGQPAIE